MYYVETSDELYTTDIFCEATQIFMCLRNKNLEVRLYEVTELGLISTIEIWSPEFGYHYYREDN